MRKLGEGKVARTLAVTAAMAAMLTAQAAPAFAQAPAVSSVTGPIGGNQQQCIASAQNVADMLGASEQAGDETYRFMVRGDYTIQIICRIPGYGIIVVAGPNGSSPDTELAAV